MGGFEGDGSLTWRRGVTPGVGENGGDELSFDRGGMEENGIPPTVMDELNNIEDETRYYVQEFRARFRERATDEMHKLYEESFRRLSEKYYRNSPWPSAAAVSYLVDHDEAFLFLYKELAYRHLYARGQPGLAERIEAWENYCDLFTFFLEDGMLDLDLPASWLWDIIDECIYQFEVWCQYRSKLKDKDANEIAYLRENEHTIWNVNMVLQYLHALVNKSGVCSWLLNGNAPVGSSDPTDEDFDLSALAVYRYIGFFSIVGLLRVHCLLGDYRLALMVLQPLEDFNVSTALFTHVTACHISVYYFMGFAHLMLRQYEDAGRVFGTALLHIGRISGMRSYQHEQVNKRIDQMLGLLAICVTFQPQYVDEAASGLLKDKFGEKLARMKVGDDTAFSELFTYACPKFVTPSPPNYDVIKDYNMDALKLQLSLFMAETRQQLLLPEIRSFLKMYTTIEMSKLAHFMDTEENTFRSHLLCLKHKSFTARAQSSNVGSMQSTEGPVSSDLGFFVDGDVVHVADTKVESRFGEFFVKNIDKLQAMTRNLNLPPRVVYQTTTGGRRQ